MLTPEGRISRYLYGVDYQPKDLRLSLLEASGGKIGTVIDRIILFCYAYDPITRRYSVVLTRVMQAGSAGMTVLFGGYLAVFWRRATAGKRYLTETRVMFLFHLLQSTAQAASSHLPIQGTEIAAKWDALYIFLIWLSVFFFVLVVGGMIYFAFKYRQQPGRRAKYITGNVPIEIVWTAIPLVLLLVIFGWGYVVYNDMTRAPSGAYEIRVIGKQWLWQFQYDDGRTTVGELYVPINKPVKLLMTSTDVIHSFFVPAFRVKQDVVPGMFTSVWFEATVPGKHQVFCTEYCGTSHSEMLAQVIVLEDQQWEDWKAGKKIALEGPKTEGELQAEASDAVRATASAALGPKAAEGLKVVEAKGCIACHSGDGSKKPGPTFKGVFGKSREFVDGGKAVADAAYIRESIEKPNVKVLKGFGPLMPSYEGMLTSDEIDAVTAYIQALK